MNHVNWDLWRKIGTLLVALCAASTLFSQTASITSSFGITTFCEGETVTLTPAATGWGGFYTYQWDLDGLSATEPLFGTSGDLEPLNDIALNAPGSYTVTLTVQDGLDEFVATLDLTVLPLIEGELTLTSTGADYAEVVQPDGTTLFRYCGGVTDAVMDFDLGYSSPVNFGTMFVVLDWGDGTSATLAELQGATLTHTYAPGQNTIVFTIINPNPSGNDCVSTNTYDVFVGSAPDVTLSSSGEELCLPDATHEVEIIGNGALVDYTISYTDGSPATSLSTDENTVVYHDFSTTSCGEEIDFAGIVIQDAFSVTIVAGNACSANGIPTIASFFPIVVSRGPELEITPSTGGSVCPEEEVELTNTSVAPELVAEGGCTDEYAFYWELDPALNLVSGNAGSDNGSSDYTTWTTGDMALTVSSDVPGSFDVVLHAGTDCGLESTTYTLNVLDPGVLSLDVVSQELCSGETTAPFTFSVNPPDYQINWMVFGEDGLPAGPNDIADVDPVVGLGIGTATPPTWTVHNTGGDDLVFTVQATVPCPASLPLVHTITVHPEPVITATPSDTTICSGQSTDIELTINTSDDIIWDYVQGPDISGATNDGHAFLIDDVLVNSGAVTDSVVYTLNAKNPLCPGDPTVVTVHVLPGVPMQALPDVELCPGEQADAIAFPSAEGLVWTWENSEPGVGLQANGAGDIPAWTAADNATPDPISGTVTVTGQVAACDPVEAGTYDVTVNPEATITATPVDPTICSGTEVGVTLELNTGETLAWTADADADVGGAMDGTGTDIQDVLTNSGSSAATVDYTVTVVSPQCPGDDVVVTVEVLPGVPAQALTDVFLCPGELAQPVVLDAVDGLAWSWTNTETGIGLAADGTGNVPSWTATNDGVTDLTGVVTVTGQVGSCEPEVAGSYEATVFPNPQAEVTVSPDGNLSCVDGTADIALNFLTAGTSATGFSGPSVLDQGADYALVDAAGTYTVDLVSADGCTASQTFEVNPIDDIAITQVNASDPLCHDEASGVIEVLTDEGDAELTWDWTGTAATTALAEGLAAGTYSVVVTNAAQCQDSTEVTLFNPAELTVALVDSLVSECGEDNGFLLVAASGGTGSLDYNWTPGGSSPMLDGIDAGDYDLVVQDNNGCQLDTTFTMVCLELVPPTPNEFISPNGDGLNEVWRIVNILYYTEATVQVFNRWGVEVYRAEPPYLNDWDGTNSQGEVLPSATYFYVIDTKKKSQKPFTGFLELQTEQP